MELPEDTWYEIARRLSKDPDELRWELAKFRRVCKLFRSAVSQLWTVATFQRDRLLVKSTQGRFIAGWYVDPINAPVAYNSSNAHMLFVLADRVARLAYGFVLPKKFEAHKVSITSRRCVGRPGQDPVYRRPTYSDVVPDDGRADPVISSLRWAEYLNSFKLNVGCHTIPIIGDTTVKILDRNGNLGLFGRLRLPPLELLQPTKRSLRIEIDHHTSVDLGDIRAILNG